jgi:hypothetical protein
MDARMNNIIAQERENLTAERTATGVKSAVLGALLRGVHAADVERMCTQI